MCHMKNFSKFSNVSSNIILVISMASGEKRVRNINLKKMNFETNVIYDESINRRSTLSQ